MYRRCSVSETACQMALTFRLQQTTNEQMPKLKGEYLSAERQPRFQRRRPNVQ